jgi:mannose-1-phosphate guanylyltransferase/mannose-1-phosphate guanylyltransferase/mannose-6-phosphate isomerase
VILCGGAGTRLWPLSRKLYPKQFMDLGGRTLFSDTLERLRALPGLESPLVVCNEEQRFFAAAQLQAAGHATDGKVLLEPVGRNTAPAIAVACRALTDISLSRDEGTMLAEAEITRAEGALSRDEGTMLLVLPSDHVIKDVAAFAAAAAKAADIARDGYLVTFGIVPTSPESGYGWLKQGEPLAGGWKVQRFVEKPDRETAERMFSQGGYCWNSGMFLFRADRYLAELAVHAPEIHRLTGLAFEGRSADMDFLRVGEEAFRACPADSIDYAVMEKTEYAAMVGLEAGWSDLGAWDAVYDASDKDEAANVCVGDVLAEQTRSSYIHSSGRLVAVLGLDNVVVVETADAVLVADKDKSQAVKTLVQRLAADGRDEKDIHLRVFRPWGWYETLVLGERFQVKRIMLNPGAQLSLQRHYHRAEHWVVVHGTGRVTIEEEDRLLHEDESVYIPLGLRHRLYNPGKLPLEVIEVQSGSYLGEDDIERYEDRYGRS